MERCCNEIATERERSSSALDGLETLERTWHELWLLTPVVVSLIHRFRCGTGVESSLDFAPSVAGFRRGL